jgi:pimeloyl-ACP methyl ester carboxylesterase
MSECRTLAAATSVACAAVTTNTASEPFDLLTDGVSLSGETVGHGTPVLLLHGLTATRRYVVHGSRALQQGDCRVISYDARGHGQSGPAPSPTDYGYPLLAADAAAVLDATQTPRAVLVGNSMGAATAVAVTLEHPDRVSALVLVTPAHLGRPSDNVERWDALAEGLRRGGPEGFLEAYGRPKVPERYVDTVETVVRQRLSRHAHPEALADALQAVPRSAAFDGLDALSRVAVPTLVVASGDALDPDHPLAVAEEYGRRIPEVQVVREVDGETPLAWSGSRLSRAILDFLGEALAGDA